MHMKTATNLGGWSPLCRGKSPRTGNPHRLLEGAADLRRLAEAITKALQAGLQQRIVLVLRKRDALRRGGLGDVRQLDTSGDVLVADHRFRLAAKRDAAEIVEEALADHGNAEVAGAEILLAAVGNGALAD